MKKVEKGELKAMQGGHYHWKCKDGTDFISKKYNSYAEAGGGADAHIGRYPAHADDTSVIYCEKGTC